MKNNKICSKLRKGANFAAANLPLRPQKKATMTGKGERRERREAEGWRERIRDRKREKEREREGGRRRGR